MQIRKAQGFTQLLWDPILVFGVRVALLRCSMVVLGTPPIADSMSIRPWTSKGTPPAAPPNGSPVSADAVKVAAAAAALAAPAGVAAGSKVPAAFAAEAPGKVFPSRRGLLAGGPSAWPLCGTAACGAEGARDEDELGVVPGQVTGAMLFNSCIKGTLSSAFALST
eukprot:16447898-Heterocapsa_arctica.AAC.1